MHSTWYWKYPFATLTDFNLSVLSLRCGNPACFGPSYKHDLISCGPFPFWSYQLCGLNNSKCIQFFRTFFYSIFWDGNDYMGLYNKSTDLTDFKKIMTTATWHMPWPHMINFVFLCVLHIAPSEQSSGSPCPLPCHIQHESLPSVPTHKGHTRLLLILPQFCPVLQDCFKAEHKLSSHPRGYRVHSTHCT